jgi:hypothetical protein
VSFVEPQERQIVETEGGQTFPDIAALVVCTGQEDTPFAPGIEGASNFSGDVLHSSEFNNGAKWKEKKTHWWLALTTAALNAIQGGTSCITLTLSSLPAKPFDARAI